MKGETVPLHECVNDDTGDDLWMPPMPTYFLEFDSYEEVEEAQRAIRSCLVNTPALDEGILGRMWQALLDITPGLVMERSES